MDFLAFLVQKLWKNKQKKIRGIPTNSLGNPYKIRGLSAITWGPETSGSHSRSLKLHIDFNDGLVLKLHMTLMMA